MKFQRRLDLDTKKRIQIVVQALSEQGKYGSVSRIAGDYEISRMFVYQLTNRAKTHLELLFALPDTLGKLENERELDKLIFSLRLEGKSSIPSISVISRNLGNTPASVGYISERLKAYGEVLPSSLLSMDGSYVFFLSDEIYANSCPILITIDPKSTAILKIELASERTKEVWSKYYEELRNNNFHTLGLCSDRGTGLVEGYKEVHRDKPWHSDHFHEFTELRKLLHKLEREAYEAIRKEYECLEKFENAKSEKNIKNRIEQYEEASELCKIKMERYDNFLILSNFLSSSMDFFGIDGHVRTSEEVKGELNAIFTLMEDLFYPPIKKVIDTLRKHLDDIVLCYKDLQEIYQTLSKLIPEQNALDFLCLAWQHEHKSYQTKSETRVYHQKESNFWLNCAEGLLQDGFHEFKYIVFDELDSIVRASSLVEMVNSLIRPYLNNCKGQITQEALNLIMFYHNHHRYKSGKRKNMAPIEILTGKPLRKEWLELLLENREKLQETEKSKRLKLLVNENDSYDNNEVAENYPRNQNLEFKKINEVINLEIPQAA